MEGFKELSDINPTSLEPKSDNIIRHCFRLDNLGFVVNMVEGVARKEYWGAFNGPNG
jgi:hypothetical protein